MLGRTLAFGIGIAFSCGLLFLLERLDSTPRPTVLEAGAAPLASAFDAAGTGTIEGQVLWEGNMQVVAPLHVPANAFFGTPLKQAQLRPRPNTPLIDTQSHGIRGAVIYLDAVELQRSRPWQHDPVRVEMRDGAFHVHQGQEDSQVGFVRRGEPVTLVSRDAFPHALRASEAAFFTLSFPDRDQPLERRFQKNGWVELTSGIGYYWMRGHLLVSDHPYYTRTDSQGRFRLPDVPPGTYTLKCWLPSWVEDHHDRDPESGLISRLYLRPPVIREETVTVSRGQQASARFVLSSALFEH
jgi:hypothetical protein